MSMIDNVYGCTHTAQHDGKLVMRTSAVLYKVLCVHH